MLRQRLRADAPATLGYFAEQDVAVKVISGDSAASVGAIARQLGIEGAEHPLDARTPAPRGSPGSARPFRRCGDLQPPQRDLAALADALEENSVFGRVTPGQKQAFVAALGDPGPHRGDDRRWRQ